MKTEHQFLLGINRVFPSGGSMAVPSIRDKQISGLVQALNDQGIKINTPHSEQVIRFRFGNAVKETSLPLVCEVKGIETTPMAYHLRGPGGFELYMENYSNRESMGMSGEIGAPVRINAGIKCSINCKGTGSEETIKTAERVARKDYFI